VATTCFFGDCPNDAQFSVYANRGDGSLVAPVRFQPVHFSYRIAAAKFSNDGKPDVVLLTPTEPRSEFALYVCSDLSPPSGVSILINHG
jgi:hypothetical protein